MWHKTARKKYIFASELHLEIIVFQWKLAFFAKQLNEQTFVHFPLLKPPSITQESSDKNSSQLMALQQELVRRSADFKAVEGLRFS